MVDILLNNFDALVIWNLLVLLLRPAVEPYDGRWRDAVGLIILTMTAIAIVLDIVFIVLKVF